MPSGRASVLAAPAPRRLRRLAGLFLLFLAQFTPLAPAMAAKELRDADVTVYGEAFRAADRDQWPSAIQRARTAANDVLVDYFVWEHLRRGNSGADFATITHFVREHPDWPHQITLRRRAEEALTGTEPAAQVVAWFDDNPPRTGQGKMLYAEALMARGQRDKAAAVAREAWASETFPDVDERRFLARFGDLLTQRDHEKRLDALLWEGHTVSARRMLRRVGGDQRALAQARMALRDMAPGVDGLVAAVPKALRDDPGLVYERLRWRRIKDLDESALELLSHPSADQVKPDLWWRERHILARRLLEKGWISQAYKVAAGHGATDGAAFAEAEWLAGWLALRFLKEPKTALTHFTRMRDKVSYPISVARADYWSGRAAEALGDKERASAFYADAARESATYYGQLAAAKVAPGVPLALPVTIAPSEDARATFERSPLVPVVRALYAVDRAEEARPFLHALLDQAKTDEARGLAIGLAQESGQPHLTAALARQAALDGTLVADAAYPVPALDWPEGPERALVLGLIRQESNFHPGAISSAGARGLMQLMPPTARLVARQLEAAYHEDKLIRDPSYNVTLGAAYLASLLERFDGSYMLALAGYNAGPSRPARWVKEYGDPRKGEIDPIDWIEMIPFPETRNYVQRVLEAAQVYRQRLGGDPALSLEADLRR